MNDRKLVKTLSPSQRHWVGNGFYVYPSLRPDEDTYYYTTPFILMDYAPAMEFGPSKQRRGVGTHPHRGFETVTFALQGEVEHKDSSGGGGIIKSGDIQWMTAASGLVHSEYHSRSFSESGGVFEMVQLWVNLPKKFKMNRPRYQEISESKIGIFEDQELKVRVIAGRYKNIQGPAKTFTKMNIFEANAKIDTLLKLEVENQTTLCLLLLRGEIQYENKVARQGHTLIFDREGDSVSLSLKKGAKILVLNGGPIDEPIVSYGPFVMNSEEEIIQAIQDFNEGKMGEI